MTKLTFDPERMDDVAARLRAIRPRIEGMSRTIGTVKLDALGDRHIAERIRYAELMAHGDARELDVVVEGISTTARRARRADEGPGVASRPQRRREGRPGGKVGPSGFVDQRPWPGESAGVQELACWMAGAAAGTGLPPELPVAAALAETGMRNIPGQGGPVMGFFQIAYGIHPAPPGFGSASGHTQSAEWWQAHPEAQMAFFVAEAKRVADGRGPGTSGADGVGGWAYDVERPGPAHQGIYAAQYGEAEKLVAACKDSVPVSATGGAMAPGGGEPSPLPPKS